MNGRCFILFNTTFDWQIDEFMVYCRSRQLREKTMIGYEQALRLLERWCKEELSIEEVDKVTEAVIRRYMWFSPEAVNAVSRRHPEERSGKGSLFSTRGKDPSLRSE